MATRKRSTKSSKTGPLGRLAKAAKKAVTPRKTTKRKTTARKRERIDTTPGRPGGSRFIRRADGGKFGTEQVDVGRSLAADRRTKAKTKAKPGMKDRGD